MLLEEFDLIEKILGIIAALGFLETLPYIITIIVEKIQTGQLPNKETPKIKFRYNLAKFGIAIFILFFVILLIQIKGCNPTDSDDPTPTEPAQVTIAINESSLIVEESIATSDEPTYIWFVNGKYSGDLNESGQQDGYGTMWYNNGHIYEGEWENGKRHGHGVYTFSNGAVYDGDYVYDNRDGKGTLSGWNVTLCLNGKEIECSGTYTGDFKNDEFIGIAEFKFDDNAYNFDKFIGEFKGNQCWDGYYTLKGGSTIEVENGKPIS